MNLHLVSCSDATGQRCLADPPLVVQLIAPGDDAAYGDARAEHRELRPLWYRLLTVIPPRPLTLVRGERVSVDLGETWHGLHFLLTGSAWQGEPPLDFLLRGGSELGRLDVGAGPARWLCAADLALAQRALTGVTDKALRARYAPEAMTAAQICPEIWSGGDELQDPLAWLLEGAGKLRRFLVEAVRAGRGCMLYFA